jgi:hypothetical protein
VRSRLAPTPPWRVPPDPATPAGRWPSPRYGGNPLRVQIESRYENLIRIARTSPVRTSYSVLTSSVVRL